jgi:hypothetical protein
MKQKDLILVVAMVFIGGVVSFAISGAVFSSPKQRQQTAEVVDVITPEFSPPPKKYFNIQSVNPTLHPPDDSDDSETEGETDSESAESEEDTSQP